MGAGERTLRHDELDPCVVRVFGFPATLAPLHDPCAQYRIITESEELAGFELIVRPYTHAGIAHLEDAGGETRFSFLI
jgi:hypothetical protein